MPKKAHGSNTRCSDKGNEQPSRQQSVIDIGERKCGEGAECVAIKNVARFRDRRSVKRIYFVAGAPNEPTSMEYRLREADLTSSQIGIGGARKRHL